MLAATFTLTAVTLTAVTLTAVTFTAVTLTAAALFELFKYISFCYYHHDCIQFEFKSSPNLLLKKASLNISIYLTLSDIFYISSLACFIRE